jgi:hypothetical protein
VDGEAEMRVRVPEHRDALPAPHSELVALAKRSLQTCGGISENAAVREFPHSAEQTSRGALRQERTAALNDGARGVNVAWNPIAAPTYRPNCDCAILARLTDFSKWAFWTPRTHRDTEGGAEVHQGLVVVTCSACRQLFRSQTPEHAYAGR